MNLQPEEEILKNAPSLKRNLGDVLADAAARYLASAARDEGAARAIPAGTLKAIQDDLEQGGEWIAFQSGDGRRLIVASMNAGEEPFLFHPQSLSKLLAQLSEVEFKHHTEDGRQITLIRQPRQVGAPDGANALRETREALRRDFLVFETDLQKFPTLFADARPNYLVRTHRGSVKAWRQQGGRVVFLESEPSTATRLLARIGEPYEERARANPGSAARELAEFAESLERLK